MNQTWYPPEGRRMKKVASTALEIVVCTTLLFAGLGLAASQEGMWLQAFIFNVFFLADFYISEYLGGKPSLQYWVIGIAILSFFSGLLIHMGFCAVLLILMYPITEFVRVIILSSRP